LPRAQHRLPPRPHDIAVIPDVRESLDIRDVDKIGRTGKAHLHRRQERHATRQQFGLVVFAENLFGLVER
jgi:hypothetical protein